MGILSNNDHIGLKRGFSYTVSLDDVKSFMAELKEQLNQLIGNS